MCPHLFFICLSVCLPVCLCMHPPGQAAPGPLEAVDGLGVQSTQHCFEGAEVLQFAAVQCHLEPLADDPCSCVGCVVTSHTVM